MKELLSKSKINNSKLRKLIFTMTANELSKLTEPCYFPSLKKYYFELLYVCGLKEKDISAFVKRFYKGTPASKWKLHSDPKSNFYIFIMYYLINNKDQLAYSSMMTFYTIRNYANLVQKHLPKFCSDDIFRYTLEKLVKNHLFSREKSISGGLYFLSKELQNRHTNSIKEGNVAGITKFLTEARHRVSQSVKSFMNTYHKLSEKGVSIMSQDEENEDEYQYQSLKNSSKVVEDAVKKITVYKFVDKKAIELSKTMSKIKYSLSQVVATKLVNTSYTDNIRSILTIFVKELKDVKNICGHEYLLYVKELMAIKRSKKTVYFKQQVLVLVEKMLDDIGYRKQYESLGAQSKFALASFIAYYITSVLRNSIC